MTKHEFLERFSRELTHNGVADVADIVEEYEQHFAFRLADGFAEEEIAAKLGDPAALAAQFCGAAATAKRRGGRAAAIVELIATGFAAGVFFLLLASWGVALACLSLGALALAVCLIGGFGPWQAVTPMPAGCAAVFGAALAALAALAAAGCVYFLAFLRQLARAYGRFHRNTMAAATGRATLPPLACHPNFQPRAKRRLRCVTLVALAAFASLCIAAMLVAAFSAGAVEFWHAWGWFGYIA